MKRNDLTRCTSTLAAILAVFLIAPHAIAHETATGDAEFDA